MDKLYKLKKDIKTVRRNELIWRVLKYSAMTLAAVTLLVYSFIRVAGNRIDLTGAEVKPTGLVQFETTPGGAAVFVDDVERNFRTPGEAVLDVGWHQVRLSLNGYHDWHKSFELAKGQVLWLNYPLLVPQELKTDEVANITDNIKQAVKSRDNRWLLLQYAAPGRFSLLALENPTNIRVNDFTLPEGVLSVGDPETAVTLTVLEGDVNSHFFTLRHDFTQGGVNKSEYLYLDLRDLKVAYNLSRELAVDIKQIAFRHNSDKQFYIIDASNNLRLLNHAGKQISAPLVENTLSFSQYDDKLVSVSLAPTGEKTVGVTWRDRYTAVKTFPGATPVSANFLNYYGKDYLAINNGQSVYLVANPLDERSREEEVLPLGLDQVDWIKINTSSRVILAGSGATVVSFDLETRWRSDYQAFSPPQFLSDFQVFWNGPEGTTIADFDGANPHELHLNSGLFFLSSDKKFLFSTGTSQAKTVLQRTQMIAER